jgi:hypothetical protein
MSKSDFYQLLGAVYCVAGNTTDGALLKVAFCLLFISYGIASLFTK